MKRKVRFPLSTKGRGIAVDKKHKRPEQKGRSDAMASTEDEFELFMPLPRYVTEYLPIVDGALTATSQLQTQTVQECLPLLNAVNNPTSNPFDFDENGLPYLQRQDHLDFVHDGLGALPAGFVGLDASRPWLLYWSLLSLYLLRQDLQPLRPRYVTNPRHDGCLSP